MKLSLCLIVKADDKEAPLLDQCLKSIAEWVDEICISITGENEEVERVAKKYKAKISHFKWVNDFAKARNSNFSQATGDWILWCDSDDEVEGGEYLKKFLEIMDKEGIDTGIADYLYDFDEYGNCTVKHRKTRIIKNDGCAIWMGKLHEDLIEQRGIKAYLLEGFRIIHKADSPRKRNAQERNLEIALEQLKGNEKDPKCIWDVANIYMALGKNMDAIKYYSDFIDRTGSEEQTFLAYHRIAKVYLAMDEYDRAVEAEFKAMRLKPWYPDSYLGLGEIYHKAGMDKHAKEFLVQGMTKEIPEDTAIVWNPRDYDYNPLMLLGIVYLELNRPEESKKCLTECLKLYPKHEGIRRLLKVLDKKITELKKIDEICEKVQKAKDKKKIKELIDSAPVELKAHPKLVHLRNVHFIKKESSGKDLVIYCYQTDEPFDPEIIMKKGRGGSEEAVYHMSKRLADLGWNVTVYANCGYKEKKFGKVLWKPWWSFNPRDKQDILVAWRHPGLFEIKEINTKKAYVWLHDQLRAREFTTRRLNRIDKVFALSKWHRDLFSNIPDEKFLITGNGIEVEGKGKGVKRNPFRLIWTSSYDRGLETLLKLFPKIKKEVPQAELHIFYGWDLWDNMHKNDRVMREAKDKIVKLMERPEVYHHGRVPQEQITEEYQKSGIWVYPTEFGEISCISAMKAQAYGAIPVTTNVAALKETVQFGLKVDSENIYSDEEAQEEWVEGVLNILEKPPTEEERKEMMNWARKRFAWDLIAKQWNEEFLKEKTVLKDERVEMDRFEWIRCQCSREKSIVDIGGNKGHIFEGWDRKKITTVDIDLYDIENFVQADAHHLPFKDNSFDTAVLAEILEHVEDPIQVLREAKRVARKMVITVPNEYEWPPDLFPFKSVEETAKKQGLTVEEMGKRNNPAKEFYTKDNLKHLYHQRYYTEKMLKEYLKKAGITDYKIEKLYGGGFAFFSVVAKVGESKNNNQYEL